MNDRWCQFVIRSTLSAFKNGRLHVRVGSRPNSCDVDVPSRGSLGSDVGSRRPSAPIFSLFLEQILPPYCEHDDTLRHNR